MDFPPRALHATAKFHSGSKVLRVGEVTKRVLMSQPGFKRLKYHVHEECSQMCARGLSPTNLRRHGSSGDRARNPHLVFAHCGEKSRHLQPLQEVPYILLSLIPLRVSWDVFAFYLFFFKIATCAQQSRTLHRRK